MTVTKCPQLRAAILELRWDGWLSPAGVHNRLNEAWKLSSIKHELSLLLRDGLLLRMSEYHTADDYVQRYAFPVPWSAAADLVIPRRGPPRACCRCPLMPEAA